MAWRNLWRHGLRTWLTASAAIFANALLIFAICLQFGTYQMMIDNSLRVLTGHLQVQAPGYHEQPRLYRTLASIQAVAHQLRQATGARVAARAQAFALISSETRSFGLQILGLEPDYEPALSTLPGQIKQGRFLTADDQGVLVLGAVAARNLKVQPGDQLTLLGSGRDGAMAAALVRVVGIFESGLAEVDRNLALMNLPDFQSTFAMGDSGHSLVLRAGSLAGVEALQRAVAQQLAGQPVAILDWQQLQPGLRQAITADLASSWFMYGVLIGLVALSVLNTQLMAVLERTREFGIMLALGLRPGRLARLVLLEAALMAGLGLLLGLAIGLPVALWLQQVGFSYPGMAEYAARFNLDPRIYPQVSAFAVLLGPVVVFIASLLAALYPATRLYRLAPVPAMRAAQ